MKRMLFLGALVLGVTVCTQSHGFELLDRMVGGHGCTSCCEPGCDAAAGCCEPACDAGAGCCEPACDAGAGCCEPACGAGAGCCEPACDAGVSCTGCCSKRCKKHDLFGGLRGLFEKCKQRHRCKSCCDSCCEPACDAGAGCCEPTCGFGAGCCEPACDAGAGCCEPACDAGAGCCSKPCCKKRCTPVLDLLRAIHAAKKCRRSCCDSCCSTGCCEPACDAGAGCCEPACGAGAGCCEPACGAGVYEAGEPTMAPAAPVPDASASKKAPGRVIAVSRTVSAK